MPRPMSSDRVCFPKAVITFKARRRSTVCPEAVMAYNARRCRPCVLSNGGDVMLRLTSFDRVCCPRAVMSCHA